MDWRRSGLDQSTRPSRRCAHRGRDGRTQRVSAGRAVTSAWRPHHNRGSSRGSAADCSIHSTIHKEFAMKSRREFGAVLAPVVILTGLAGAAAQSDRNGREEGSGCAQASALDTPARVQYKTINVQGINIFYREAGPGDAPAILL